MKVIHKMTLTGYSVHEWIGVPLPEGAQLLDVQVQRGVPVAWYICETDNPSRMLFFYFAMTGAEMDFLLTDDDRIGYLGSYQVMDGNYVYHVFVKENSLEEQ